MNKNFAIYSVICHPEAFSLYCYEMITIKLILQRLLQQNKKQTFTYDLL